VAGAAARPYSLRFRLLAGTLLWIVVALAATGLVLAQLFERHAAAQFQAELQVHLNQLAANLELDSDGRPVVATPLSDPRLQKPLSGLYWQVRQGAGAGEVLLRSRSLWDGTLVLPPPAAAGVEAVRVAGPGGREVLALAQELRLAEAPDRPLRLVVAADSAVLQGAVRQFVRVLVISLGVLAAGLGAAAVAQVVVGLAPLRRLGAAVNRLRAGSGTRLEGRYPAEVQPLVDDFNAVIERNAQIVARARTQAGNLAHAGKTPLAVLANAAHDATLAPAALAALVGEQAAAARRQVDWHLSHARAAAARDVPGLRSGVGPLAAALVRVMRRVHAARELAFDASAIAAGAAFAGEAQDLQEMLGNLVDNACKWAAHSVRIGAGVRDGRLDITVEDDGPGLAPAQREAVLARGVRADEQVPGSGLGLAITADLAAMYGGSLRLEAAAGGGLRATLTLPAG
jgi:signal transduction histidine kinase